MADQVVAPVAPQLLAALLADGEDLDRLALGQQPVGLGPRQLDDGRVEAAARPRSAVITTSRCTLSSPVPGQQLRRAVRARDRQPPAR
jgi:hypothetical protein